MIIPSSIIKQADGSWLFTWTGTAPFEIWLEGSLLKQTSDLSYAFKRPGYNDAPPPLEIVDGVEESGFVEAENETYPPFIVFQWRGVLNAAAYQLDQYEDGEWVSKGFVKDTKKGYYQLQSSVITDGEETTWRIRPIDIRGKYGNALNFVKTTVRNPAPPDVIFDFSSAGKVVVEEA